MIRNVKRLALAVALGAVVSVPAIAADVKPQAKAVATGKGLDQVGQIVIFYLENRAFDHLYGLYPGANGIKQAIETKQGVVQVDKDGKPYDKLPAPFDPHHKEADHRFPADLPNGPFQIDKFGVTLADKLPSPVHEFYANQRQINGGKNDRFVADSNAAGMVMGHFDGSKMGLWKLAQQYTLLDNFFQGAFGGSYLNHQWMVCLCAPTFPNAPKHIVTTDEVKGKTEAGKEAKVTTDGYAVNTINGHGFYDPEKDLEKEPLLPPQTNRTIGDSLTEKGVSWTYYAEGFNSALKAMKAGKKDKEVSYHHHPFTYYKRFLDDKKQWERHLRDKENFEADIAAGKLPAVSWYKPFGVNNQHPGRKNVEDGDKETVRLIKAIQSGPQGKNTLIIVTYDENGGYWDHVAPPKGDRWGPGTRIPTILISPWTKGGRVDNTEYETTSIIRLIEEKYGLKQLGDRKANSLSKSLKF